MNIFNPVMIFSAELSTLNSDENLKRSREIAAIMLKNDINFKSVKGVYKGIMENSFVVDSNDFEFLKYYIFNVYNQESVLNLDANRFASLLFNNGTEIFLGQFQSVEPSMVPSLHAYTFDASTNTYYAVL